MSSDHKTPCSTVVDARQDIKAIEDDMKEHARELGGIAANLTLLLDGQRKLFDRTDELCRIADQNRMSIKKIEQDQEEMKDKIGNGLKDEIAAKVIGQIKAMIKSHGPCVELREKRQEDKPPAIRSFTDFLNYGWWQLIHEKAWVIPAIMLFLGLWFVIWGGSKWKIFGEIPFPTIPPIQGK
jgi:hypothetical protein